MPGENNISITVDVGGEFKRVFEELKSEFEGHISSLRSERVYFVDAITEVLKRHLEIEKRQEEQLPGKRL